MDRKNESVPALFVLATKDIVRLSYESVLSSSLSPFGLAVLLPTGKPL